MKTVEKLFDSEVGTYDSKHINNTSTKVISESLIDDIERDGITSEMLDNLGLPVYRYRTQITIHGIFPDGCDVRVGGYKNLVKNQNGSLGVRYTAIDRDKRRKLYDIVQFIQPNYWRIENSSTTFCLEHMERIKSKSQYDELKSKAQNISDRIKGLAHASVGAYIARDWSGYVGVLYVNVKAIYQDNLNKAFHAICPEYSKSIDDAEREWDEYIESENKRRNAEREELDAKYKIERAEREKKAKENLDAALVKAQEFADTHGMVKYDTFDCRGKKLYVLSVSRKCSWDAEYELYLKLIEGKNAIHTSLSLNSDFQKKHGYDRPKRINGTELKNVWVKLV